MARARASASDALVVMPARSTPRWTIVWAIWGRMPLMMHSAPHQPRRSYCLQQMLRHQGVDDGDAGDVDDRHLRAGLDDPLQQGLHDHLRP